MAQHHYTIVSRLVVFSSERPAQQRIRAGDLKETGSNQPCGKALRLTFAQQRETKWFDSGDGFERTALFTPVEEVCGRDVVARDAGLNVVLPERNDAIGVAIRQWAQQHGIDYTEDSRVRADAESKREHHNDR